MKSKEPPSIRELFLDGKAMDRAMRKGVREALLRHKRAGVPIVVWRSGKVVRIPPSQIRVSSGGSKRRPSARSVRKGKASRASR
jgi:hypothetical protein